jgi:6-phosphogluconolactonase
LFPHTEALKETRRWVVPNFVKKFETWRFTFTRPILDRAAEVLFLVAGADKADRLVEVLEGPPRPDDLPSQSIDAAHTIWLIDEAAASQLSQRS